MVLLYLRGEVRGAWSDKSPEPGPLLHLAEVGYDPQYNRYLDVLLLALGIAAFTALLVVDPSGWNTLLLVDVENYCLIAALGTVALFDR